MYSFEGRSTDTNKQKICVLSAYLMRIPIAHFPKIAQGRLPDPALADWKWFQPDILTVPDLSPINCQNLLYPFLNVTLAIYLTCTLTNHIQLDLII